MGLFVPHSVVFEGHFSKGNHTRFCTARRPRRCGVNPAAAKGASIMMIRIFCPRAVLS